jgi:hypothetical protein
MVQTFALFSRDPFNHSVIPSYDTIGAPFAASPWRLPSASIRSRSYDELRTSYKLPVWILFYGCELPA